MKVALIFKGKDKKDAESVEEILQRLGIDSYTLFISSESTDLHHMASNLANCTHVFFGIESDMVATPQGAFITGFAAGRRLRVFSLHPMTLPFEYDYIQVFGEIAKVFAVELVRWNEVSEREKAKRAIFEDGHAYTDESLAQCVIDNNIEVVLNFIRTGYDLNAVIYDGSPLTVLAARQQHIEILESLLQNGANIDMVNDRGNSALMEAATLGFEDVLDTLLRYSPDLNILSKSGQTALILAVGEGRTDIVKRLVQAGAVTEIADALGMTALKYATLFGHSEVIEALQTK